MRRIDAAWSGAGFPVTEQELRTARHTTSFLACGAIDAPLLVFVHGWPELSISWRHQLPVFAALGFRVIAPDMRGYGRSSVYDRQEDYALEHIVADMLELIDSTGCDRAVWVGHDWGSPVVWALASHHPQRCHGVANLCVPYFPKGFQAKDLIALVDRSIYPAEQFPAGQWEYQLFYRENFDKARRDFEANVEATVKALFRKGDPSGKGKPSRLAFVRRSGGFFGPAGVAPDLPRDADVLTETDLAAYTEALTRNGFTGPGSWYMNGQANQDYSDRSVNGGHLDMKVLFLHADYDYTCETVTSQLAVPMRDYCANLSEVVLPTGHWMAQENPVAVNKALAGWLCTEFPSIWAGEHGRPVP